jgi:hypothetical protein
LNLDGVLDGTSGEDGCIGPEVDGGGMYGGEKCGGELARVEAVLVEEDETVVAGVERGKKAGELRGGELVLCDADFGREGLQGGVCLEGEAKAGENAEAIGEFGVEREAEVGQRKEMGGVRGSPRRAFRRRRWSFGRGRLIEQVPGAKGDGVRGRGRPMTAPRDTDTGIRISAAWISFAC